MKKVRMCVGILLMAAMLGGCGGQIPDMSDEQREAISEYAVDLLLKYDTSQSDRLVDLSLLEKNAQPEATEAPVTTPEPSQAPEATEQPQDEGDDETTGMKPVEDTPTVSVGGELSEDMYAEIGVTLLLPEHVSLEYRDYQVVDSYTDPKDAELTLDANPGRSLLVVRFVLLNSGSETQSVDMLQDNIKHTIVVDDTVVNAMVTLLSNDMITYMGQLAADESAEVVLLAELEESVIQNAGNISVELLRDELISKIVVK